MTENVPSTELAVIEKNMAICNQLLTLPHYKKLGAEGLLAILMVADALGVDKRLALNGGLYLAKSGCIEMRAATMALLIRKNGHSVVKDPKSDNKICILHGKRADNGDTWIASFSVQEAINAGLINNYDNAWKKYPADMLYNRALSRLARQLFPDVIGNCYVEGEISQAPKLDEKVNRNVTVNFEEAETIEEPTSKFDEMAQDLWLMFLEKNPGIASTYPPEMPAYLEYVQNFMKNTDIRKHFEEWSKIYDRFLKGMAKWYEMEGQYSQAGHIIEKNVV